MPVTYGDYRKPPQQPYGPGGVAGQPFPNISSGDVPMAIPQIKPLVFGGLEELRREGVFGRGGVERFKQMAERSSAMRRRKIGLGLQRGFGRRGLKSRSGAFANALMNRTQGEDTAMLDALFKLYTTQDISKLGGLEGLQTLFRDIKRAKDERKLATRISELREGGGGGAMGWVTALTSLLAAVPSGGTSLAALPGAVEDIRG